MFTIILNKLSYKGHGTWYSELYPQMQPSENDPHKQFSDVFCYLWCSIYPQMHFSEVYSQIQLSEVYHQRLFSEVIPRFPKWISRCDFRSESPEMIFLNDIEAHFRCDFFVCLFVKFILRCINCIPRCSFLEFFQVYPKVLATILWSTLLIITIIV